MRMEQLRVSVHISLTLAKLTTSRNPSTGGVQVRTEGETHRCACDSSAPDNSGCSSCVKVIWYEYRSICLYQLFCPLFHIRRSAALVSTSLCGKGARQIHAQQRPTLASRVRTYDRTRYLTRSISVITSISLKCSSSLVLGSDLSRSTIFCCSVSSSIAEARFVVGRSAPQTVHLALPIVHLRPQMVREQTRTIGVQHVPAALAYQTARPSDPPPTA